MFGEFDMDEVNAAVEAGAGVYDLGGFTVEVVEVEQAEAAPKQETPEEYQARVWAAVVLASS